MAFVVAITFSHTSLSAVTVYDTHTCSVLKKFCEKNNFILMKLQMWEVYCANLFVEESNHRLYNFILIHLCDRVVNIISSVSLHLKKVHLKIMNNPDILSPFLSSARNGSYRKNENIFHLPLHKRMCMCFCVCVCAFCSVCFTINIRRNFIDKNVKFFRDQIIKKRTLS